MGDSSAFNSGPGQADGAAGERPRLPRRQAAWTYDDEHGANCYYVYFQQNRMVAQSVQVTQSMLSNGVVFDLAEDGTLIGIEVIFGPPQPTPAAPSDKDQG